MASRSPVSVSVSMEKEREVSLRAGEIICRIYDKVLGRWSGAIDDAVLQMVNCFCVRLVFCLYADDAGLFAKGQFLDYLRRASTPDGKRALLLRLFYALNLPSERRDRFDTPLLAFPHVNGGLFAKVEEDSIPLLDAEICALIEDEAAAGFNWADISPTIFGGLFESTINPKKRRMGGMHYTSVENIHKVIDPLFLDELKAELATILGRKEKSGTVRARKLKAYCARLASLTFLDPACGSGNFLTETFISLRRLENEALQHLADGQGALDLGALVSINQFYGIEINDFAVAVAKTALWIAAAQMWKKTQEFTTKELPDFQPPESYGNIREANALAVDWTENVPGRHIDYVISNPPFVGYSHKTPEQRDDMRRTLGHLRAWGKIDYVGAWFYRAAQLMQVDPATRAAFVATNSIVQGEQASSLWKPLMIELGVHILFAYRTFKWVNEAENVAAVHCVIIAISAQKPAHCVIFDETGTPHRAAQINSYLMDAPRVFVEPRRKPVCPAPTMINGNRPTDGGHLIIEAEEYNEFIAREPRAVGYIKRFLGSSELINGKARYCLWLVGVPPDILRTMPHVMARIAACKAARLASPDPGRHKLADTPALFRETNNPDSFLAVPVVSSEHREYIPMMFSNAETIAGNTLLIIPDATVYHFGILTSAMHMAWMRTVAGRLELRYSYSASIVYNNFPWPESTAAQRAQIEAAAQAVLDTRAKYLGSTLADLYDPLLMPPDLRRAHKALDAAVDAAYGRKFSDEAARVSHLFTLYEQGAGRGRGGENEVPGGKGGRGTMVGGRANAKYEVRSTKYEVEIRRNSVAREVGARRGRCGCGGAGEMWGEVGRTRCRAGKGGIGVGKEVPGGKGGGRTTVGGGANAKYEVRSTKYEVEIRRNSVARRVWAQSGDDADVVERGRGGENEVPGGKGGIGVGKEVPGGKGGNWSGKGGAGRERGRENDRRGRGRSQVRGTK